MVFFLINCTKETQPEPSAGYKRNVVIELFSYHGCPNCPFAEKAVDSLYEIHGDSLVVIEYHDTLNGDTISPCIGFVKNREGLYNVSGFPTVVFDGVVIHIGGTGDLFTTYLNTIKDRYSKKSSLKVETLSASFADDSSIVFNITISSDENLSGKLFLVLTEDSVVFGDSTYHFVTKQVFPDAQGIDFSITESNPFNTSGSIPLSWTPLGNVWLNVFVQNSSDNTIYQGANINLGKAPSVNPAEFQLTVTPDTFQTVLPGTTATFDFYIKNTSAFPDSYIVTASQIDTVPGWMWQMCSGGVCHMPAPVVVDTLVIAPNLTDSFDIEVITNSNIGIEKINIKGESMTDTTVTHQINIYTEVQ